MRSGAVLSSTRWSSVACTDEFHDATAPGSWWSRIGHMTFFLLMAAVAAFAATMLLLVDRLVRTLLRASDPRPE